MEEYELINSQEAVDLFLRLLSSDDAQESKALFLKGETKMGKTHLLQTVYRYLSKRQADVKYIVLDAEMTDYNHLLHHACAQYGTVLETSLFSLYSENFEIYVKRQPDTNQSSRNFQNNLTLFSKINLKEDIESDKQGPLDWRTFLTTMFVQDVVKLNHQRIVFAFDDFDYAQDNIKRWLLYELFAQLIHVPHVRIVVAGQSFPKKVETLLPFSLTRSPHELLPVKDSNEYILYLKKNNSGLLLSDIEISEMVLRLQGVPGFFVEELKKKR